MEKEQYIKSSIEIIQKKNLQTPFKLDDGSTVNDLELYLKSLINAYKVNEDPRILKLFHDKIEFLKSL